MFIEQSQEDYEMNAVKTLEISHLRNRVAWLEQTLLALRVENNERDKKFAELAAQVAAIVKCEDTAETSHG